MVGGARLSLKKLRMDGMRKGCRDLPCKSVAGSRGDEKERGEVGRGREKASLLGVVVSRRFRG